MAQVISSWTDLANLQLSSSLTTILKSRFTSYRHSKSGNFNFLRSLGVSLLEYTSCPRSSTNFNSNLLSVVNNVSNYLQFDQSYENIQKQLSQIIPYLQHPQVERVQQKKEYLDDFYKNPNFDYFIMSMVKLLIAVAYVKFRDHPELGKFIQAEDFTELIVNVLNPNNIVSEHGNNDIGFLATLLECSIKVLQVNKDSGFFYLNYNENEEDKLYMIDVENVYHPLYTIDQLIYDEENTERRAILLESYKKISSNEIKTKYKELEGYQEERKEPGIKNIKNLEIFKNECIRVLNLLLSENPKSLAPEFLIKMENLNENFKILEPKNSQSLRNAISERQCHRCSQGSLLKIFLEEKKEDFAKAYSDDCQDYLLESIRKNNNKCKECNQECPKLLTEKLKKLQFRCISCGSFKNILKGFSGKFCETHPRLCNECLGNCLEAKKCISCDSPISTDDVPKIKAMLYKMCELCKKPYKRSELLDTTKTCFCNICPECQSDRFDACVKCDNAFSDDLLAYLMVTNEDIKIQRQSRKARTKTCPICYSDKDVDLVRILPCNHIVCEECLVMLMSGNIKSGEFKQASICPVENCKRELGELIMRDLLTPELWNKWNLLVINNTFQIIHCPRCNHIISYIT